MSQLFAVAVVLGFSFSSMAEQPDGVLSWNFTFEQGKEGWTGDFAHLYVDYDPDMFELEFAHTDWPEDLGQPGKALMISGVNRSDDLFMYVKRRLGPEDGVLPGVTYRARFVVELATDAPPGLIGPGGAPGEAVWVKVGAAPEEPVPVVIDWAGKPYYVMNVDKGYQRDEGQHAIMIGDAAKESGGVDDWSYELKTLDNLDRPLEVTADEQGSLWVFVGTDSGFEGKTTLYYTSIEVELQPIDDTPTAVQNDSWGAIKEAVVQ